MKWWLICDEDVDKVKNALRETQDFTTEHGQHVIDKAQYAIDTGLHKTDCVPADFQEKPIVSNGLIGG